MLGFSRGKAGITAIFSINKVCFSLFIEMRKRIDIFLHCKKPKINKLTIVKVKLSTIISWTLPPLPSLINPSIMTKIYIKFVAGALIGKFIEIY